MQTSLISVSQETKTIEDIFEISRQNDKQLNKTYFLFKAKTMSR